MPRRKAINQKVNFRLTPEQEVVVQRIADIRFENNFSQAMRFVVAAGVVTPEVQRVLAEQNQPQAA